MKKFAILLIIAITLLFTSCGSAESTDIICSSFPQYDLARIICGDRLTVGLLVTNGDPHSFELSVTDMEKIKDSKLFIYTGGHEEEWAEEAADVLGATYLRLFDSIQPIYSEEGEMDMHIWSSPLNAISMAQVICEELSQISPQNEEYFTQNFQALYSDLQQLHLEYVSLAEALGDKPVVVGDGDAFKYLQRDYGIRIEAAMEICGHHSEPQASRIAELIDLMEQEEIGYVFYLDSSSKRIAKTIAEPSGAAIEPLYSCHSLTIIDEKQATYIELMRLNLQKFMLGG